MIYGSKKYAAGNTSAHRDTLDALDALKQKLRQFQKRTGDPCVLKWQHEYFAERTHLE
jgi:hypothetical protein